MPYVAPDDFPKKLSKIRRAYEKETKKKLHTDVQPSALALFFGAKDLFKTDKCIQFLEHGVLSQKPRLKLNRQFLNQKEFYNHVLAVRFLLAASVFVLAKIDSGNRVLPSYSVLRYLLVKAMATTDNPINPETRDCSLRSTSQFMQTRLEPSGVFSDSEWLQVQLMYDSPMWAEFTRFIASECHLLEAKHAEPYPVTAITMPAFANFFEQIGKRSGDLISDWFRKSERGRALSYSITLGVNAGLYFVIRPLGLNNGLLLFAPSLAGILTDSFCTVSMAYLVGKIMRMLGGTSGFALGMTLDLSWNVIGNACLLIKGIYQSRSRCNDVTGFTLTDGQRVEDGFDITVSPLDPPPAYDVSNGYSLAFEISQEGIALGPEESKAFIPWNASQPPCLEELHRHLLQNDLLDESRKMVEPSAPLLV